MSNSSKGIPFVTENTLDPAAGLNDAIKVIDALVQPVIIDVLDTPPVSPEDGDAYVIDVDPTGAWAGREGQVAYWAGVWQFLVPKTGWLMYFASQGSYYRFSEGSPAGVWGPWSPSNLPVVTDATTARDATALNAGQYVRFTNAGAKTFTFDVAEGYVQAAEYHGRNVGAGDLTLIGTGFTINPPAGGTLVIPSGGTFTVKIVDTDEADLIAVTVPA